MVVACTQPHLMKLEMADESSFPELPGTFSVLMHTLMFIWKHSKFYNTPSRLVVLMREVCNDLIKQVSRRRACCWLWLLLCRHWRAVPAVCLHGAPIPAGPRSTAHTRPNHATTSPPCAPKTHTCAQRCLAEMPALAMVARPRSSSTPRTSSRRSRRTRSTSSRPRCACAG
jgi:hypothetical protein